MKSNSKKENIDAKKKYVFFTDPDIIVQRAEISAQQDYISKQSSKDATSNVPVQFDLKSLESLSYHSVQPYPFTFISAVKRKLALNDGSEVYRKTPNNENAVKPAILESDSTQNLHQVVQTMDFVRPLKVPDLKISAKKLDFSNRENCASKELVSQKFETPAKEFIHERGEKSTKSFERVQRRLDFSTSDVSSTINSDVEPLKVPNISISSNLSKKKECVRENSREKENRSKRIRKDESLFSNQDETIQDFSKRSKSPRHASRKDISNNVNENTLGMKLKNDRLSFHIPKESDFAPTKPKPKNFATSTAKKINDKKHRSINTRSLKSRDFSYNESLSERSSELSGKITTKESRNMFENFDSKHKNDSHTLKQIDDQICTFLSENRQVKQHQITCQTQGNIFFKEQNKKSEKVKPSTSKMDNKIYIINSKEFEDIESVTDSDMSLRSQSPIIVSTQQIKNKDSEKIAQSVNKSNKVTEDLKYVDDSLTQSTNVNTKREETSFTESIATTIKQTSNSNESNLNNSILSSALLDPRKISFRDENQSQQEEFCDLITPDMNLMPRSKRKREFMQNSNMEAEFKYSKHNMNKIDTEKPENSSLLHPTALHMQFKAELHLLDSFNESLRQVIDVEKCLYDVKQDQEKELPLQHSQSNDQVKSHFSKVTDERNTNNMEHSDDINISYKHVVTDKVFPIQKIHHITSQTVASEFDNVNKVIKPVVKAVEVQTQTMNDIATQTNIRSTRRNVQSRCSEICGMSYEQEFVGDNEIPHLSLDSVEQFGDLDQIEEISLSSKLRTMSEISLHETTSSIRTETGTEISISTRDIICSFNKYLDFEIAQLLQDEKQRYDKIEMLFKSREKTLIDRTKKLVKLEEQKRALKDTGQDSRVSSVKKKQRALLLKLQQEKDEMNRLKELHKIASQERKLMLQKQRNMFNPQISTKNILTKLKRSADSQSPRKLSGPMKGYDIRSNSSMSSLLDSDKSQHDRSQIEARMQISENDLHFSKINLPKSNKFTNFVKESNVSPDKSDEPIQSNKFPNFVEESNASLDKSDEPIQSNISQEKYLYKAQKDGNISKYEIKSRKFEEKMPKADIIKLKSHQHSVDPKLILNQPMSISGKYVFEKEKSSEVELSQQNSNKSISEHIKSDSETLVEELSKKSKPSQTIDDHFQSIVSPKEFLKTVATNSEILSEEISSVSQDTILKTSKSSQVSEDILQTYSKSSKRSNKSILTDMSKNTQYSSESKSNFKRRSSKCQKSKSSSSIDTENILGSKSNFQMSEELVKHHNKRTKIEKEFIQDDKNDDTAITDKHTKEKNLKSLTDRADDYDSKENVFCQKMFDKNTNSYENFLYNQDNNEHNFDGTSTKPQIGNFAISHHSSGENNRNYSKSVIVSSQDHNLISEKLEQVLNAREAALTSRKNCVKNWMAWHTKLKAEEDHVTQMEQAALKLITAASSAFLHQDTTVSSDTSDIEGRIELLTETLAKKRIEMSRLKKEAKKQTKQKLRALEANLLNQIKKYDTTIYEMRKKLESEKGFSKDNDKLAIESKSLADFKIPEIPLKKLQDMFKCSDLLRSRSESDLFSTKRLSAKDSMKNINLLQGETIETDRNDSEVHKSSKSTRMLEQLSFAKMSMANDSTQVFDENISEQIESDKLASASMSLVSGGRLDRNISCETGRDEIENNQNVSEVIRTESNISKSETDIITQSEAKLSKYDATIQSDLKEYKSDFDTFSEQSRAKTISSQFEANKLQHSEYSHISSRKSNDVQNSNTEIKTELTNDNIDFSKKMDFLRLNNQILNEDISSLENELKILSEMMSRFNKTSNKETNHESQSEEKSTSKDISEILSVSDKNNETSDVEIIKENKNTNIELYQKKSNSDISQYMTNDTKLKSVTNFSDNRSIITKEVDNVISIIMPESKMSLSKSNNQEIDYKARSKKILNEIEKSIISEHIKGTKGDISRSEMLIENNNLNLYKKDEKISSDTSAGIRSLSETYSKTMQSEECTNAMEFETIHSEENVDTDIEENLVNSRNLKNRQSLESNKNLSFLSEKSNSNEKNESLNQCTDLSHSPIINDVLTVETHSENKSDSSLNILQDDSKQTIVTEYINELLKRQISPQLSNLTKINNNSIDYMKNTVNDGKYKNINDVYPTSEVESVKLILNEYKEFSDNNKSEVSIDELISKEVSQKFVQESKQNASDHTLNISKQEIDENESQTQEIFINKTFDKDDRIASDSFGTHSTCENSQNQASNLLNDDSSILLNSKDISQRINDSKNQSNVISDVEDVENMLLFIPKSESNNIAIYGTKFEETIIDSHFENSYDKAKDILDIITKNNDREQYEEETEHSIETDDFQKAIYDSVIKILDKVEKSIEDNPIKEKIENANSIASKNEIKVMIEEKEKSILSSQNKCLEENKDEIISEKNITFDIDSDRNVNDKIIINEINTETAIDLDVCTKIKDDENMCFSESKSREIIITELELGSAESESLSELEIDAKIELAEEELREINKSDNKKETQEKTVQELKSLEPIIEQDSSDGEQLDNLVEVTETVLDVIEKEIKYSTDFTSESESISHNKTNIQSVKIEKNEIQYEVTPPVRVNDIKTVENIEAVTSNASQNIIDKTFDILKDPEYEDISEESLEVSEIFDKSETQKSTLSQKSSILGKYEAIPKSGDVLKILDEIAQKFSSSSENDTDQFKNNKYILENNKKLQTEISDTDSVASSKVDKVIDKNEQSLVDNLENQQPEAVTLEEEDQLIKIIISSNETAEKEKQEQDVLSESSEGRDTPKGVSEIEMDSPRDLNDSKLNIDVLNDDLLSNSNMENQNTDSKNAFHTTPIVATSEKDIEVMIDKLKASLKQPGMEVADWEAKLLRIEQLQIELEIKKLEAEEVSFYVREIPNKPPPPYTPPGSGARISTSLGSPSPPPAVIPSNIEELTAFTEKATAIIFEAKETGEDIMNLEAPSEICELTKENDETVKKDRRIYNTFLFDLCKETIAEVYQAEYEKPGPSWTKPNVKTKPTMKIPKTIQELNAYVNKEVATLFGFKTKLQRENMVMRWSRKRRDRVDELLAREAQAEEDEWTKFHHDELAVKNGLTVTILDTLLMETVNVVKVAYAKKRKVMV
ncbi:centrosome-associated protein 350-like isoform X2 [Frieseomelitta varia]|uniref:centrosome-associated protein 350-like isoform X2 n=1 Tax=Frieseomelitta varia TaxID=561572 RepID=UPI001CB67A65|nr:centrosome-associated protein 350-like isoform X2 [Frieseomelitta varia]